MKLPGGEQAVVDIGKLRDYCLSSTHVRGRHKARVFASVLGLTLTDAELLQRELLRAAGEGGAIARETDEYGARYTIVRRGETVPRLTSCYVPLN